MVKQSRNRHGVAQRAPGGLGSQISWHSALEGGYVSASRTGRFYSQEMFLVLIFTRGWVDPSLEGICHWKIPVTPQGIDPGTVRLVAQRLNHYATLGPKNVYGGRNYIEMVDNEDVTPWTAVQASECFRRTLCFLRYGKWVCLYVTRLTFNGGSKFLWTFSTYLPDNTASHEIIRQ
jgi:hypothetical protein